MPRRQPQTWRCRCRGRGGASLRPQSHRFPRQREGGLPVQALSPPLRYIPPTKGRKLCRAAHCRRAIADVAVGEGPRCDGFPRGQGEGDARAGQTRGFQRTSLLLRDSSPIKRRGRPADLVPWGREVAYGNAPAALPAIPAREKICRAAHEAQNVVDAAEAEGDWVFVPLRTPLRPTATQEKCDAAFRTEACKNK